VDGLNSIDGSLVVSVSVIRALVDGYNRASDVGLLDGAVTDFWMQHALKVVPGLGKMLDNVGNLLHQSLGRSTRRRPGADTPPVTPEDMKRALADAEASVLWDVLLGLVQRDGVQHKDARMRKDEVRVTTILNMLLFMRHQKWSWMARDLSLSLDMLPSTHGDLLNQLGYTLSSRSATTHRRLDAKSHPSAVKNFFDDHKNCLISLMIDDFTKIYLQRRQNGAMYWDVQQYATLLVKAFPDSSRVPAGASLHDPNGINVARVGQYLNQEKGFILNEEFEGLIPGVFNCPSLSHTVC